jgi:hypothetical protein
MKAIIYFENDPSVGMFAESFEADIPTFEEEYREETRSMIKKLYEELYGEMSCRVYFSDEKM